MNHAPKEIINKDGVLLLVPGFLEDEKAFSNIAENILWKQNQIRVFGKTHDEPRLTAWFGPPYNYSSIKWPEAEIPNFLQEIANKIQTVTPFEFNAVLLNYYRNGNDSMGWHRDNEKEIDTTCIASLSLGATRKFKLRHRSENLKHTLELKHGDLVIMLGLQEHWEHSVPKELKCPDPRINLTFRRIVQP